MKILNCLIGLFLILLSGNSCLAQQERIDSLKKALRSSRNEARVDCLNALSGIYIKSIRDTLGYCSSPLCESKGEALFSKLALQYADLAYPEAVRLHYIQGLAESLSYKGELAELSENFTAGEKFSRQAISWYRQTSNKKRLADTYFNLGHSLYAQSYFAESIRNFDTAYDLHKRNRNSSGMFWARTVGAAVYHESGNYEKAFEFSRECLDIATTTKNDWFKRNALHDIGWAYDEINDHKTAVEYYRRAGIEDKPDTLGLAQTFTSTHQFDSAKFYFDLVDTSNPRTRRFYLSSLGDYYFLLKQYGKSLEVLHRSLSLHKQLNDRNPVMQTFLQISKTYSASGNTDSAIRYGKFALSLARETGAKLVIKNACEILSSVYDRRHQLDSAYYYYKDCTTMKDSILSDQVKGKLAAYNFEQKMETEREVQKAQLQRQALLKNIFVTGTIILLLLGIFILRNINLKRRNETQKREIAENELQLQQSESKKQFAELEMQALRAQMSPHFIFNSLNSINRFILQNNKAEASEYLTKFSRLVRLILQNSQASLIPLESELESLRLYLELEVVRFDNQFEFEIRVHDNLDTDILKVPPLIIQPYAENAIWHGLMHKEEKGHLVIEIYQQQDDVLCYKITDDGIGRKKAAELKSKSASKHKSMGMRITAERIAMLQQKKQLDTTIKISDLVLPDGSEGGTEVLLRIPMIYDEKLF